jgi:LacI family transcriptional regulator
MISLKELAEKAKVSERTVRRVINNAPHIHPEKVKLVKRLIAEYNYVPNILAQGLRKKKTGIIGLVACSLSTEVYIKKLIKLQKVADENGFSAMSSFSGGNIEKEKKLSLECMRFCEGLFFMNRPSTETADLLAANNFPYVVVDDGDGDNSVYVDRSRGIFSLMEKMREKYVRFLFISNDPDCNEERRKAFLKSMDDFNISAGEIIYAREADFAGGVLVVDEIIKKETAPTLCVCYNDRVAAGVYKALIKSGRDVPGDFGIVGFDNDDFTEYTTQSLSTISHSVDELADKSFALLLKLINKKKVNGAVKVQTEFIGRETTL